MKKAILIFTKVPKVGEVKTRLTEAKGGILTPAEANDLYEACLLDVIDTCFCVGDVDIWVCYNQSGDRLYLDTLLAKVNHPEKITGIFCDRGGSFDDCMQYATDYILKDGSDQRFADGLIIIGGDLPTLQPVILKDALEKLERLSLSEPGQKSAVKKIETQGSLIGTALIEGACQDGGFSLVGLTCTTPFDFHEVFYNLEGITALDMLVNKAEIEQIPLGYVEMVPDLDIPVDLASHMPVLRAIEVAAKTDPTIKAPRRILNFLKETGIQSLALPPVKEAI